LGKERGKRLKKIPGKEAHRQNCGQNLSAKKNRGRKGKEAPKKKKKGANRGIKKEKIKGNPTHKPQKGFKTPGERDTLKG